MERKLAAILIADAVGYTRLSQLDEEGTRSRFLSCLKDIFEPRVVQHHGRLVKTMGDGLLVEFQSVVNSLRCALDVQQDLALKNAELPPDRQLAFRIGINLGDVIVEGDDVHGDGVNIADRLQGLASPGGICVSETVYGHVANRADFRLEELGEQRVKNISHPIRAFSLAVVTTAPPATGISSLIGTMPPRQDEQLSIAVLPFTNMSGEVEQEFFADGLTEDIITALSHFHEMMVISRNSTFAFKGKSVNVQDFARTLNVRYVVEGSVRKSGNRVRITVQLIEALADRHVWAGRYDRELADIFDIQDDVTSSIVATVVGRVEAAEHDRVKRKTTENMAAYECVLAAKTLHHRSNREDNAKAQDLIARAVELDPDYAHAHAWKACIIGQSFVNSWSADAEAAMATVAEELAIALGLDDNESDVHRILAAVHVFQDQLELAVYHQERALGLNPNDDLIVVQHGEVLTWLGRPEEGIEWIKRAMRLNPYHPERFWNHLGRAYFVARRYGEAIESFRRIARPDKFHHAFLAASYAMSDAMELAASQARTVLNLDPAFRIETYSRTLHYKDAGDADHHREALLRAGLPP